MNTQEHSSRRIVGRMSFSLRLSPLASAVALALAAGGMGQAYAQQAFSPAWFANKGAIQSNAAATGRLPNGAPASTLTNPLAQQQRARDELKTSIGNLGLAAQAIALQQAQQAAARQAALRAGGSVPDGLGAGGLEIDSNSLTAGWLNAKAPVQTVADGKTTVRIEQTADKAILNWETFNVGRNTTVAFDQQASWSVLNRVTDPLARPSQILGQIQAPGTVMIINRNGVVFSGGSQVNLRNLVASAVGMSDAQFNKGLFSEAQGSAHIPTFANDLSSTASSFAYGAATGSVVVEAGATISTQKPSSVTEGGGYVLLLGKEAHNAGEIITASGQTVLAAGDAFIITKGLASDANINSTTRGNVVTALTQAGSEAGLASNSGLITATTGDITLTGRDVRQQGVAVATTSVHTRGTIHLNNAAGDATGKITLDDDSVTAIVLDEAAATTLDAQRETLIKDSDKLGDGVAHRRDQSLVLIDTAGAVNFNTGSLTLATGGQILVNAADSEVKAGATLDVSGAVGVRVAMESNNVLVNVQGNEQRDASVNRDDKSLNNKDIWIDRRDLVFVPAGTNGYETDRWYTAGGLLEVGGYLGITGHGVGEWMAQGGTVQFSGGKVSSRAGSLINLAGGTLDVQTGYVSQTYLKGADGRIYNASNAPGDLRYTGLYRGYEAEFARWGVTETYANPLILRDKRLENGYTVGRDAGRLVIATQNATLEGSLDTTVFQGTRQTRARDTALDGYQQAQTAVAQRGQLIIGSWMPIYEAEAGQLRYSPAATVDDVTIGNTAGSGVGGSASHVALDSDWLNSLELGELQVYARRGISVDEALALSNGGTLALHATQVDVNADLIAHGGSIALGNLVERKAGSGAQWVEAPILPFTPTGYAERVRVGDGVTLDASGVWNNLRLDAADISGLPFIHGGSVSLRSNGNIELRSGSLIDVSSGATLGENGKFTGGRGGNVTLGAGMQGGSGLVQLDGEIRGHGVKGGGALLIDHGTLVSIGGSAAQAVEDLPAGTVSELPLRLAGDYVVQPGETIPLSFSITRSVIAPGQAVQVGQGPMVSSTNPLTLQADWLLPGTVMSGGIYHHAGATLPAGSVVTDMSSLPIGYLVPAAVFPNGIPVNPVTTAYTAGTVAAATLIIPAGTRIPAGATMPVTVAVQPFLELDQTLFQSGFSSYSVQGRDGVRMADGTQLAVTMPVLTLDPDAARALPTGEATSRALSVWLPPLQQDDAKRGEVSPRGGASLTLTAGSVYARGDFTMGEGSRIEVDPGRSITLEGNSQITLDGTLLARGGRISVLDGDFGMGVDANLPQGTPNARSLWVGEHALLDVSGLAFTSVAADGRAIGQVLDGGTIELGGRHDLQSRLIESFGGFLVVQDGARLDASGTSGTVSLPGLGNTVLASHGGAIALNANNGIYIDGDLQAHAGGAGAMGGTLAINFETPVYGPVARFTYLGLAVDDAVRVPRELVIEQLYGGSGLAAGVQAGQMHESLAYGQARYGVDAIHAGGFDTASLYVNGLLSFDGDVDLRMNQALYLTASAMSLSAAAPRDSQVKLAAPYLRLAGSAGRQTQDGTLMPNPVFGSQNTSAAGGTLGVPEVAADANLMMSASMVDIVGEVGLGVSGSIILNSGSRDVERDAFGTVRIQSQGDLRLRDAAFYSPGNTTLAAAQIYGSGKVSVGITSTVDQWNNRPRAFHPDRYLTIERMGTVTPATPYSVFSKLEFSAATVNQGGVIRAPLGSITLGETGGNGSTGVVNLLPGSITSVSANGLVMPYGGTADGLIYNYNGADVLYDSIGFEPKVDFQSHAVHAQEGAVIDLSGGGELTGAAFLQGRGGSTDARLNPLVQLGDKGFTLPGLATNPVYAIVPGAQANYAPVGLEKGAGDPAIGRQITIGEGVPGLPAGTYTLLPSTYALLPGAFRVELNGLAASATAFGTTSAMRNGSWSTSARLGIANTGVSDTRTTQIILTAADTVRTYSQYNETSYAEFAIERALREGVPRPLLERDGKAINLQLNTPAAVGSFGLPQLVFDSTVLGKPADGGYGTVARLINASDYEILGTGAAPTAGYGGVSVHADTLNTIGASRLEIGGMLSSNYMNQNTGSLQNANVISIGGRTGNIVLREGALLRAADVFLISGRTDGGITLEQGSGISTLGMGESSYTAGQGYIHTPGSNSVLALSNGQLEMLPPTAPNANSPLDGAGAIEIGVCATGVACSGNTLLYSEGTIATSTDNRFVLGDTVRYGTRNLSLALGGINVGSAEALAAVAASGALPSGMTLNQQVIDRLLLGDTSAGTPALEALSFTARESVNFFGDVTLSTYNPETGKSALQRLVLATPAIYGYGDADSVARIHTDTLIWTGALTPAGAVVAGGPGTGSGKLVVDAREVVFGYGPRTQPDTVRNHERLALGFTSLHLNASERVTATHRGSLAVYQSQGAWDPVAKAYSHSGGDLFISTPLLTGGAGSINKIAAGGDIHVSGTGAPAPDNAALAGSLGAELGLDSRGGSLVLDTAVLLPSGKLSLSAQDDVLLADGSQLDLAGRKIDFYEVSKYSWGGDVTLDSRGGDVRQDEAARIDLSAQYNRAGKLTAQAAQGEAALAGQLAGGASGHYDAGGTLVPYTAGRIEVYGNSIADFAGLNARLNEGGVTGGRSFRLGQGDLTLGDEVRAHEVNLALDDGHLIVNGRIDASGEQAGSIRLAAKEGVTIAGTAVLDTHASVLRRDSYGKVIEAPNRAVIEIDSGRGTLAIASGARMDLGVAGAGANYGTVALNAPRLGGNDVDIDAAGSIAITGAKAIQVNAFITDDSATPGTETTTDGKSYQIIDQDYLDRLDGDSRTFINAARANGTLMNGKLAGLRGYTDVFHLRPGVEVVADLLINPDGNLHVDGDIDLSGHRYASVNPHTQQTSVHGSGEAGALVIRAQGDLDIFGSISDGFDGSRLQTSLDSSGWVLTVGRQLWGGDVVVPHGGMVTLDAGTIFNSGRSLNYDLPIASMQMAAGTLVPVGGELAAPLSLARGTVLSAAVYSDTGALLYAAGTVLADAATLPIGTRFDAGFRLPAAARLAAMDWPAGVPLPTPPVGNMVTLASALTLDKGALIPSDTDVRLPGGVHTVDLRPGDADGNQGRVWAAAPMLAAGSQSFDITLVAGADFSGADRLATRPNSSASLRFSDMHYGQGAGRSEVPGTGEPAVYRWAADADAATWESWGLPGIVPGAVMTAEEVQSLFDMYLISESPLELNDWGLGSTVLLESEGTPPDYVYGPQPVREQLPSVVRTGTGDLRVISASSIATSSLFGIYTAGTQSASLAAAGSPDPYNQPRSLYAGSVLGEFGSPFESLVDGGSDSLYQAWYPEAGGNLLLRAGGDITGDTLGRALPTARSEALGNRTAQLNGTAAIGNWLWRQGSGNVAGEGDTAVPTAWWINFGTYVPSFSESYYVDFTTMPRFIGFTGIGTLGGGNLVLEAGGDAGMLVPRADHGGAYLARSSGLNLTVASTGRVAASGELVLTGGGDLDIRIGGGLNADPALRSFTNSIYDPVANINPPRDAHRLDLNGTFTNLRGALRMEAGAVGGVEQLFGGGDPKESRPFDVFTSSSARAAGGPVLVVGDAGVRMEARGDLVLASVVDPGRVPQYHGGTPFSANGASYAANGWSWFSLWTPSTAIDLLSAGGNLTPTLAMQDRDTTIDSHITDLHYVYPAVLRAAAASGSVYYGKFVKSVTAGTNNDPFQPGVTLAPSPVGEQFVVSHAGQLELLAAGSIYASGTSFSASGADPTALPNPFNPGFVGRGDRVWYGLEAIYNVSREALAPGALLYANLNGGAGQRYPLFSFTPPTASGYVYAGQESARYYAVEGDLVGLRFGSIIYRGSNTNGAPGSLSTWYDGGGAVALRAGRDIINAGTLLGTYDNYGNTYGSPQGSIGWITTASGADPAAPQWPSSQDFATARGNLVVHTSADDVSVIQAGRDIRSSSFYIAGPGLLDVSAGRDVYMADGGELRSMGPVVNVIPGDRASGAGIALATGMGKYGANWTAFADRYLDPGRLADPLLPLADQPGAAVRVYNGSITLAQWLASEFGYTGDEAGAADFLAAEQLRLDTARAEALASGGRAANRNLEREYKLESQLHLVNWLTTRFGGANGRGLHFDAATMDARAFFDALPVEQRSTFLRNVYYAELRASGREYNEVDGKRSGSYLRGREAIETLLPSKDAQGETIAYKGDLTMFSSARYFAQFVDSPSTWRPQPGKTYLSEAEWRAAGSPGYDVPFYKINDAGIHTDFGGDISLMVPGGRTLVGVDGGYPPGAGSGVLTQGEGDINIFSLSDILMGQSRVFTTFGGNILAWSAEGDINAGRGAKTTIVYTPQRRVYDEIGNVSLSPSTPNTGAGIATLNPIPEVPPGDIDLIAPLGTIDAGEAGIRVSGNVNLAALHVVNAENIQVQGEAAGIPVVAAVNVGALSNASAAAAQASTAAQDVMQRERAAQRQALPSVFTVRVIGFGNEAAPELGTPPAGAPRQPAAQTSYDPNSAFQLIGHGPLNAEQLARLTPAERRTLDNER
ncbi:filamentous hemagglutinin N-terminal domain-containing protein [Azoarcus sp. TTM-91]|nr:filamentous hemagglutinin N-terminal domain-containing protein [Azoarcus sp. TTM-91]